MPWAFAPPTSKVTVVFRTVAAGTPSLQFLIFELLTSSVSLSGPFKHNDCC